MTALNKAIKHWNFLSLPPPNVKAVFFSDIQFCISKDKEFEINVKYFN